MTTLDTFVMLLCLTLQDEVMERTCVEEGPPFGIFLSAVAPVAPEQEFVVVTIWMLLNQLQISSEGLPCC